MGIFVYTHKIDITIVMDFTVWSLTLIIVMVGIVKETTIAIPNVATMYLNSVPNLDWHSISSK
jgi:hypothetical protein